MIIIKDIKYLIVCSNCGQEIILDDKDFYWNEASLVCDILCLNCSEALRIYKQD
jgi:hypothetical protein